MDHPKTPPRVEQEPLAAELARYGIMSVPSIHYEWGGYRYSNPADALAAAKRVAA